MILNLDKTEIAVLLFHMALMRNNVKKGFKKKENGQEVLNSFDEVKTNLETKFAEIETDPDDYKKHTFNFNINEYKMLESFLTWYIPTVKDTLKKSGSIKEEDRKQLDCLENIQLQLTTVLSL